MRRLVLPLSLTALCLASVSEPARACRCAQLPVERYWESAEIVLVGRVTAARPRTVDGVEALAVEVEPVFDNRRPFKGSLDGVTLLTPVSSARCGVPVEEGESYVLFAARESPTAAIAWFDSCGGSRLYAGGTRAQEISPFVGLERNRIVPRLFELAATSTSEEAEDLAEPATPSSRFHTSPACWDAPRTFHSGSPDEELRERAKIVRGRSFPPPEPPKPPVGDSGTGEIVSPNGAYVAWIGESTVYVDVERAVPLRIEIEKQDAHDPPEVRWINEKLLFLRVHWGRVVWTDLIADVERGVFVYEEQAMDGTIAFQQFQEQCGDQCPPCEPPPPESEDGC